MAEAGSFLDARFTAEERRKRDRVWRVLCRDFFQQFIKSDQTVLDMGAGCCEFINNIECKKKYALDISTGLGQYAARDVEILVGCSTRVSALLPCESVDVVFISNFLEHIRSKDDLKLTLQATHTILAQGGRLLILQPNIRYCYKRYWDFYDHHIPLSHKSLEEVLCFLNFRICMMKPKFLPYSTKTRLPLHPLLVKLYLKLPVAHMLMGKQMFVCAQKC